LSASLEVMVTLGVTVAFTVVVIELLVAVVGLAQLALEVSTHVTISPLLNPVVVYVELVCPLMLLPFNFHWYPGLPPPLVMDELKVTLLPVQMELSASLEVMEMLGVTLLETTLPEKVKSLMRYVPDPPPAL